MHFQRTPSQFRKIINAFDSWNKKSVKDPLQVLYILSNFSFAFAWYFTLHAMSNSLRKTQESMVVVFVFDMSCRITRLVSSPLLRKNANGMMGRQTSERLFSFLLPIILRVLNFSFKRRLGTSKVYNYYDPLL